MAFLFGGTGNDRTATLLARRTLDRADTDRGPADSDNERNGDSPAHAPGDKIPVHLPSKRSGRSGADRKKKLPGLY